MARMRLLMAAACLTLVLSAVLPGVLLARGASVEPSGVQNCLATGGAPPLAAVRVAAVVPVFTATPYSFYPGSSFYAFYKMYAAERGNVTTNLGLLKAQVSDGFENSYGWGSDYGIKTFLESQGARSCGYQPGTNVHYLTDVEVDGGALMSGAKRLYDAAIVGHEEYVTMAEFSQLKDFVASGGRLIMLDGNAFTVQVSYSLGTETLVAGHGWQFDGARAWRSGYSPFNASRSEWVGSVYCCFLKFTSHHVVVNTSNAIGRALYDAYGMQTFSLNASREQDRVTNLTGTSMVAKFVDQPGHMIGAFVHRFHEGYVVSYSAYGSDAIMADKSVQSFVIEALTADLSKPAPPGATTLTGGDPGALGPGSQTQLAALVLVAVGAGLVVVSFALVRRERRAGSVSADHEIEEGG